MLSRLCAGCLERIYTRIDQLLAHSTAWIWKD